MPKDGSDIPRFPTVHAVKQMLEFFDVPSGPKAIICCCSVPSTVTEDKSSKNYFKVAIIFSRFQTQVC